MQKTRLNLNATQQIAAIDQGQGPVTLVLVHGWGCESALWEPQINELSRDYRVMAIDLPGHGETASEGFDISVSGYAGVVVQLVEALADDSACVLVGHSLGSAVVVDAAAQLGERVHSLVLLDGFLMDWGAMREEVASGYLQRFSDDFSAAVAQLLQHTLLQSTDEPWQQLLRRRMQQLDPAVGYAAMASLVHWPAATAVAAIQRPMIAAHTSKAFPRACERVAPFVQEHWLPQTGHFPQQEAALLTTALIREAVSL